MVANLYNGDCLEVMQDIPDNSIDFILTDLPYGTTVANWDKHINFISMWKQINRIVKNNSGICFTASQPFTSLLVNSNIKNYKHHWIWEKEQGVGFQVAKFRPMMKTEDIIVFEKNGNKLNYYPQMIKRDNPVKYKYASSTSMVSPLNNGNPNIKIKNGYYTSKYKYPVNILKFKRDKGLHPTQKPIALLEYLIKTYTKKNERVLDFTMGSGSTGVACVNTNRNFIGIEIEEEYFKIAQERIGQKVIE